MSAPRETRVSAPRKVAVVGLGEVGTVFARALQAQGVAVAVASRDNPRAAQAAEALGLPLVPLAEAASGAEIVLVTVTGESPVVDVQTLTQSTRISNESLDNLPISRNMMDMMTLNVGATIAPVQRA